MATGARVDGRVSAPGHGFVGRGEELQRLGSLLRGGRTRLVSIVGPGGIGKTRLAVEAFREFRSGDSDVQVHWARLSGLEAGAGYSAVEQATASAVVGTDFSGRPDWRALVETLASPGLPEPDRRAILVLDNCEHVPGAARRLVSRLLETVAGLMIVATSRGPIGWADECLIGVPPLTDQQALTHFRQRAELIGRPLVDETQVGVAAEICRHVHHNPLFIQLAVGRLRHQPLSAICSDLSGGDDDRRMSWSSGAILGAEPRHMTVTDVIAWSHDLLTDRERVLFERLSVFASGFVVNPDDSADSATAVGADLDAISAICGDDDPAAAGDGRVALARDDIEDLLQRLVDQGLVTAHLTTTSVRWSLSETLRVFARARLRERGGGTAAESVQLARRHLCYYRDRVVAAAGCWFGPDEGATLDWATAAWDNIVVAIQTSIASGEAAAGLEINLGLIALRVPFVRVSLRDVARWTSRCLEASARLTPQPTHLQVAARAAVAWLAVRQGRSAEAAQLLDQCVAACLPGSDITDWRHSDTDLGLPARVDLAWGTWLFMAGRDRRAVEVLLRAREKFRALDDGGGAMLAGMFCGFAAGLLSPEPATRAREIAGQCLDAARAAEAPWAVSWAELSWATALIKTGDPTEAVEVLQHALGRQLTVGDHWGAAWAVEMLTWAIAAIATTDRIEHGSVQALATTIAVLAGGVTTLRTKLGIDITAMGTFADESARAIRTARQKLDPVVFATALARGTRMRPGTGEVYDLALGALVIDLDPWKSLTRAEQDAATMIAIGHSYQQAGRILHKSRKTIQAQVLSLRKKLAIEGNTAEEILAYLPEDIRSTVDQARKQRETRCPSQHAGHDDTS